LAFLKIDVNICGFTLRHYLTGLVMYLTTGPDRRLGNRRCLGSGSGKRAHQLGQINPWIEAIGKRARIAVGVLREVEMLARAFDLGFQIAQQRVDLHELWQVTGLSLSDQDIAVCALRIDNVCKASQAIAVNVSRRLKVDLGPTADGFAGEAAGRIDLHVGQTASLVQRNCDLDRHFVLESAPRSPGLLSVHIGIVRE
jgi:hypothetical protein